MHDRRIVGCARYARVATIRNVLALSTAHGRTSKDGLMAPGRLVSVVDDDESVRESLPDLLRELGFSACAFASAEELLSSTVLALTRALVLDVALPHMSGPALQQELAHRGITIPIVFITAQQDDRIRQQLLAAGAVDVLIKPFSDSALLESLTVALRGQ